MNGAIVAPSNLRVECRHGARKDHYGVQRVQEPRNYHTTKNKRLHPERVEWKKYCPRCNKHQVHKETK